MSNPVRSDVHVNRPLSNIAVATIQAEKDFIHQQVFPNVPVLKQSDLFYRYTRDYWFRSGAQKRAPATESAGSGYHLTTDSYFCDKWAFHQMVDDDIRANQDDVINVDKSSTEFVMRNLLIRREQLFAQRFMTAGVWQGHMMTNSMGVIAPTDFTPDISWSDDNSNPVADVGMLKIGMKRVTSLEPNVMVVSPDVNERLLQHPLVIDRIKYTQKGIATEDLLAELFRVGKYLVASAVYNSSQEGQLANYNFINNNKVLLVYSAPAPGLMVPSAGYIFSWSGLFGGSAYGSRMKTMRMEHLAADRIEGEMAFDMKQVSGDLGILGVNLLSA